MRTGTWSSCVCDGSGLITVASGGKRAALGPECAAAMASKSGGEAWRAVAKAHTCATTGKAPAPRQYAINLQYE